MTGWRGWAAPMGAAAVVVALVLGVHALVTGGAGGGGPTPDQVERVVEPAQPVTLSDRQVTVLGYRSRGTRLTVSFRLRAVTCPGDDVQVAVSESLEGVVVHLRLAPGPSSDPSGESCAADPAQVRRAAITLSRPLLYRGVFTGVRGGHPVPRLG